MTSRAKGGTRGAALVEYVMLLSLIGVTAIASVSVLGGKVEGTFDVVSDTLSSTEDVVANLDVGEGEDGAEEPALPPGPTFTWKGDGTDILQPGVTRTSDGWIIDIDTLAGPGVSLAGKRYNAWISKSGTFVKRWPQYSDTTSSYEVHARAHWIVQDIGLSSIFAARDGGSPSGSLYAYTETSNRQVPNNVIGIKLEEFAHCNTGSICQEGPFNFDIDFYTLP